MLFYFNILFILPICIMLLFYIRYLKRKKLKDNVYILFFIIFSIYIMNVINLTLFPIHINSYVNTYGISHSINLIPFNFPPGYWLDKQIYLNVLLTMPFGFGIFYVFDLNIKKTIIINFLTGITIECLQFIILILTKDTTFIIDVNDAMFNIVGAFAGFVIFKIFSKIVVKTVKKYDLELNKLTEYIYYISEKNL